jgi:hypothetical protein
VTNGHALVSIRVPEGRNAQIAGTATSTWPRCATQPDAARRRTAAAHLALTRLPKIYAFVMNA